MKQTQTPCSPVNHMSFKPVACVSFLACVAVSSRLPAADTWSSFQNGGQCQVPSEDLPLNWSTDEGIAWSVKLTGYGQSSPVIWNDTVYVTSVSGDRKDKLHVRALGLSTGKTHWEHTLANSTPEESTNYVSKAAPTPVADAHGVIAFFEGGNLLALDREGAVRWERDLVKDYGNVVARHGLSSSLEQDEKHVFVWIERSDDPYVLAVEKQTGETVWKAEGVGKTAWSSPRLISVDGEQHLVLSASGRIIGLDPTTGKRLWRFEELANNTVPTPMPLGNGRFLIGASEGRGEEAVAPLKSNGVVEIANDGEEYRVKYVWRAKKATSSFGSPIVAGGNAYFVNRAGVLFCVDAKTGKRHYAERVGGSVWATPVQSGNCIYLFGRDGATTVIKTGSKFQVLAENRLWEDLPQKDALPEGGGGAAFGGPVLYAVAVAGDRFVLRRGERLYCVGKQAADRGTADQVTDEESINSPRD